MNGSPQVLLTLEQIEGWEQEAEELAREIADDQVRLDQLRAKIKAAEFFRPAPSGRLSKLGFLNGKQENSLPLEESPPAPESDNMVAAIEHIANSAQAPVPKKVLKHMLAEQGFAADRLANYFYTAIHRLKSKERISVLENGSVWKDPHTLEANSN